MFLERGYILLWRLTRIRMLYYLPMFLETGYISTKKSYKNQDGILLTCVPRESSCYTLTKEAYKNQDVILLTYVSRERLCFTLTKEA